MAYQQYVYCGSELSDWQGPELSIAQHQKSSAELLLSHGILPLLPDERPVELPQQAVGESNLAFLARLYPIVAQAYFDEEKRQEARLGPKETLRPVPSSATEGDAPTTRQKALFYTQKVGAWSDEEEQACMEILPRMVRENAAKTVDLLWMVVSAEMEKLGFSRSPSSIKNAWNRKLRSRSGFDERRVKRPAAMTTGTLRPKEHERVGRISKSGCHTGQRKPKKKKTTGA